MKLVCRRVANIEQTRLTRRLCLLFLLRKLMHNNPRWDCVHRKRLIGTLKRRIYRNPGTLSFQTDILCFGSRPERVRAGTVTRGTDTGRAAVGRAGSFYPERTGVLPLVTVPMGPPLTGRTVTFFPEVERTAGPARRRTGPCRPDRPGRRRGRARGRQSDGRIGGLPFRGDEEPADGLFGGGGSS